MNTTSPFQDYVSPSPRHKQSTFPSAPFPKKRVRSDTMTPLIEMTTVHQWNQHAQKLFLLGKTSTMMAHDLNNILFTILGYIELALGTTSNQSVTHKQLLNAILATKRGTELVQQFQETTEENAGKIIPQPLELGTLITEAITLLRPSLPHSITIKHINKCHSGVILGHSLQILRLLHNLLSNAINAMASQKNGLLHIQLDEITGNTLTSNPNEFRRYVRLAIKDNGPGIPNNIYQQMFCPFFTASHTVTGRGLGLTIVDDIIKEHKGYIRVDSQQGQGSSFMVYLPQYQDPILASDRNVS